MCNRITDKFKKFLTLFGCALIFTILTLTYHWLYPKSLIIQPVHFPADIQDINNIEGFATTALPENVTFRLQNRRKQVRIACDYNWNQYDEELQRLRSNKLYMKYINNQKRVVIDSKNKLAMCLQAKGGSYFWKYIFLHMDNHGGLKIRQQKSMMGLSYVDMESFKSRVNSESLNSFTIYVFGRNPWDRLVSLYRQKIESKTPDSVEYKYVKGACLGAEVDTFEKLLKCVLHTWNKGVPDRHWEPLTTRCDICNIPYDYIGRVEYMNEEASEIFKLAGISGNIDSFLRQSRDSSIRSMESKKTNYHSYYGNVSRSLVNQLGDMYKNDINILGFPASPYV